MAENPDAATNDVVAAMKKQRITVGANYVSTIRSKLKGEGKKKAAKKKIAPKKQAATDQISLSALKEAKRLAAKLGGIDQAKEAISALAQLTD